MVETAAKDRQADDWSPNSDRAIRLADRHAGRAQARGGSLGNSREARQANCASDFHGCGLHGRASAWIHQEEPKDSATRARVGATAREESANGGEVAVK